MLSKQLLVLHVYKERLYLHENLTSFNAVISFGILENLEMAFFIYMYIISTKQQKKQAPSLVFESGRPLSSQKS